MTNFNFPDFSLFSDNCRMNSLFNNSSNILNVVNFNCLKKNTNNLENEFVNVNLDENLQSTTIIHNLFKNALNIILNLNHLISNLLNDLNSKNETIKKKKIKINNLKNKLAKQNKLNNCSICFTNISNICMIECGHLCICEECRDKMLIYSSDNKHISCPICRKLTSTLKIFYS